MVSLEAGGPAPARRDPGTDGGAVRRLRPIADIALGLAGTAIIWQVLASSGFFGSTLPGVLDAGAALVEALTRLDTYAATWATLSGWFLGLLIAVAIAVPAGLAVGSTRFLADSVRLSVDFLRTIPPVVYIPLLLLTFGATPALKVMLIVLGAVWPLFIQAIYAIREVDPVARDVARVMRLPLVLRVRSVLLPSALPFLFTGLRVAAAFSLLFALAAELLGGAPGIGRQIVLAQLAGDPARAFAFLLISGGLGIGINAIMLLIQRRVLSWHVSTRGAQL